RAGRRDCRRRRLGDVLIRAHRASIPRIYPHLAAHDARDLRALSFRRPMECDSAHERSQITARCMCASALRVSPDDAKKICNGARGMSS
ncbi:hypothetical protein, partial [Burkholderia sp. Tr-862]|uniref:hypothetical protein n=1 Tax=Burkholderia sp. Tr-862 TaxID=2608331 RepID=UPI001B3A37AF